MTGSEVISILISDNKGKGKIDTYDHSFHSDLTLDDSVIDPVEQKSTNGKKVFRCLYCDNYFSSEHINPYPPEKKNFRHIHNLIHSDGMDQGHLCEPFYRYCIQKENELQTKYTKDYASYAIEQDSHRRFADERSQISVMNKNDEDINQFIDAMLPANTIQQLPEDFDGWFSKKLHEKKKEE